MNCNTTHYRANSSSVPGDPTYVNDYADRYAIPVEFSAEGSAERLPARTQAELLRIAQEALTNVHRHADATSVSVCVRVVDDAITVSIVDNGNGFALDEIGGASFGLAAMRERASIIGAELKVTSAPSQGTRVTVRAPLDVAKRSIH